MRPVVFFLSLLMSCVVAAQSDTLNRVDTAGKKQGYWIITGSMAKKPGYAAEAKAEEGRYVDNKKTGMWITYWPNGNKNYELVYHNNRINGRAYGYTEKGMLSEKGTWVRTRWVGDYVLYYENDTTVRQRFHFNALGQRDSTQLYYHPNGKLAASKEFRAGKEHGRVAEFDTTGRLYRETFYTDGFIDHGKTKLYPPLPEEWRRAPRPHDHQQHIPRPNGKKKRETVCRNGKPTGDYKDFDQDGKWLATFQNHKIVEGKIYVYDENGLLKRIQLYKDGKYIGDAPLPD